MSILFSKNFINYCLFLTSASLAFSCQNNAKQSPDVAIITYDKSKQSDTISVAPTKTIEANPNESKNLVYSWLDNLNIRDKPNAKGKVVAVVQNDEALGLLGEKTSQPETVVLRGVAYNDLWLKVVTKDKIEGWVFGGCVKLKGEVKGNQPITDEKFDFPYFGSFDLTTWKKMATKDLSGGDAETKVYTYQKDTGIMEITKTNVGEYGYSRTYKLMDAKKKLLKSRIFEYNTDPYKVFIETVTDYTTHPAEKHTRSQKMNSHFILLKDEPLMVNGAWNK